MAIIDQLNKLDSIKADIKSALVEKGQNPTNQFDTYGDNIRAIEGGGDGNMFKDMSLGTMFVKLANTSTRYEVYTSAFNLLENVEGVWDGDANAITKKYDGSNIQVDYYSNWFGITAISGSLPSSVTSDYAKPYLLTKNINLKCPNLVKWYRESFDSLSTSPFLETYEIHSQNKVLFNDGGYFLQYGAGLLNVPSSFPYYIKRIVLDFDMEIPSGGSKLIPMHIGEDVTRLEYFELGNLNITSPNRQSAEIFYSTASCLVKTGIIKYTSTNTSTSEASVALSKSKNTTFDIKGLEVNSAYCTCTIKVPSGASYIDSFLNCLMPPTLAGAKTPYVGLSSSDYNKLTDEQKEAVISKGWGVKNY